MALTALLMNSRQSFYALTFLNDFKRMGRRRLYMIHTLTDETYAVNCTLDDIRRGAGRTRCSSWLCCAGFYWISKLRPGRGDRAAHPIPA